MEFRIPKLEEIYDRIEAEQSTPMSEADGYRWGLDYLKDIIRQLEKLEQQALQKNNPAFYNNIRLSMERVKEAQAELDAKLGSTRE